MFVVRCYFILMQHILLAFKQFTPFTYFVFGQVSYKSGVMLREQQTLVLSISY